MSLPPEVLRWPNYPPLDLRVSEQANQVTVTECIGVRRKYIQLLTMTSEFLHGCIVTSDAQTDKERFDDFGKYKWGSRYVGHRLVQHNKRDRQYHVNYCFWTYEWKHAVGCDGKDHCPPSTGIPLL